MSPSNRAPTMGARRLRRCPDQGRDPRRGKRNAGSKSKGLRTGARATPRSRGRGSQQLARDAARELNIGFVSRMTRSRPWVRLKTAASLDGRTAPPNGGSRWITGPEARRDDHPLGALEAAPF